MLPHIYPVVTFVALISLMDNFRVFEPIIGFSAEGSAQSLSWLIYDNLVNEEVILFGSAAATPNNDNNWNCYSACSSIN